MTENKVIPDQERQSFIESVVKNPSNSFAVLGIFHRGGFWFQEAKGPLSGKLKKSLSLNESVYSHLFAKNFNGPEFQARVAEMNPAGDETWLFLSFNDRQQDKRGACHTDFVLTVPKKDEEISKIIEENPDLLIDIFRAKFPEYDRSSGSLRIDQGYKKITLLSAHLLNEETP